MSNQVLLVERQGNCALFTLNRPEKRNALNHDLLSALNQAIAGIENDKEIRAVIVRANGTSFCSGLDLAEARHGAESRGEGEGIVVEVFQRLERLPMPTIAAVQGAALAGGCELALHCDLRIAAADARIGMTVPRVGLVVPYDLVRKLIEILGAANAARILYTGEPIGAAKALEIGMVHEVVAPAELEATVRGWADKVTACAPMSLRVIKRSIRRAMSQAHDTWHDDIVEMTREVWRSRDAIEGMKAFLEKRKPVWRNE